MDRVRINRRYQAWVRSTCIVCGLVLVLLSVPGCTVSPFSQATARPTPTPLPVTRTCCLSITETPVEDAMVHFQDPISQQKLAGIQTRVGQAHSIYTVSRFGPSDQKLTSGVTAVLQPGDDLTVHLLLIYTLEATHDLGFLATLDYTPLQVSFNGTRQALPMVHFEPGTKRAFRLSLSPVPAGLHTLVVSYLMDPDFYPDFACGRQPEPDQRIVEFVGLRGYPFELGITLYVTPTAPATISDWPAQARAFPPDETVQLHNGLLLKDCPADGSGYVLIQDTAKAGEVRTYLARFYGTTKVGAAKWADMPVHLLVLWDDALTQAEHMDVPVRATEEGTCLPLSIRVPSHLSPGKHSLTVMAYPYPHYLRFLYATKMKHASGTNVKKGQES